MVERRSDLGAALRREAEQHVPDRDAMLSRIAQRRAEPRGRWAFTALFRVAALRPFAALGPVAALGPAAAAASVVATLVVGFAGIKLAEDRGGGTPVATVPSGPAATASSTPGRHVARPGDHTPPITPTSPAAAAGPAPASTATSPAPVTTTPRPVGGGRPDRSTPAGATSGPVLRPSDAFLRSEAVLDSHSNDTWTQGNLNLRTSKEITALDLVISVVRTEGVEEAGKWSTVPTQMITVTVAEERDVLRYRFTLNPGRTLAPGDYVFAVQYLHVPGKRNVSADTYGAVASAASQTAEITGTFRPT